MLAMSGIQPLLPAMPEGVDLAIRSGNGKRVFILTNYAVETQTVTLPSPMEDILQGGKVTSVTLPQYGVAVLR
jgi:beta-galactosidase